MSPAQAQQHIPRLVRFGLGRHQDLCHTKRGTTQRSVYRVPRPKLGHVADRVADRSRIIIWIIVPRLARVWIYTRGKSDEITWLLLPVRAARWANLKIKNSRDRRLEESCCSWAAKQDSVQESRQMVSHRERRTRDKDGKWMAVQGHCYLIWWWLIYETHVLYFF